MFFGMELIPETFPSPCRAKNYGAPNVTQKVKEICLKPQLKNSTNFLLFSTLLLNLANFYSMLNKLCKY